MVIFLAGEYTRGWVPEGRLGGRKDPKDLKDSKDNKER
jgi:hypothetical protein